MVPACAYEVSHFSCVRLFVTPWTVCSPPGSSVHGILQARTLQWVAMPSSRGSSRCKKLRFLYLLHWQAGSLPLAPPGKYKNTLTLGLNYHCNSFMCVCVYKHSKLCIYIHTYIHTCSWVKHFYFHDTLLLLIL